MEGRGGAGRGGRLARRFTPGAGAGRDSQPKPKYAEKREASVNGGAEGDRTPDLRNAIATLSQLSYGPEPFSAAPWEAAAARGRRM